jgi:hypothetical protein
MTVNRKLPWTYWSFAVFSSKEYLSNYSMNRGQILQARKTIGKDALVNPYQIVTNALMIFVSR